MPKYNKTNIVRRNPMIVSTTPRIPAEVHVPKWILSFLLVGLIIGVIIYIFFLSGTFKVKQVIIEGPLVKEIRPVLSQYEGKNIFQIRSKEIDEALHQAYPEVYDVKVYRGLPDTLKIRANKREVALIWEANGKAYLLDRNGLVYQEIRLDKAQGISGVPKVKDRQGISVQLGKRWVSSRFLEFIKEMEDGLRKQGQVKIVGWEIGETSIHAEAVTDKNWRIMLDTSRPAKEQLDNLEKILKIHINDIVEYVDLRVPGYAYYK